MSRPEIITETARLRLRHLKQSDLPFVVELFGSLEVMRYSRTGPLHANQAAKVLEQFLRSYSSETYSAQPLSQWGVVEKSTEMLIGLCGFWPPVPRPPGEWELAYRFLAGHWGQGFATETATACREIAFSTAEVNAISAFVEPTHTASIRVAEKVGLRFECEVFYQGFLVHKYLLPRG